MTLANVATLTRHFVLRILSPPLLSELGHDYVRRTLASAIAMLLVAGSFLTRALFRKYVDLNAAWDETGYWQAVHGDTLMMIALPMLVVALITVLLAPSLFPDETDYRVLAPLPISGRALFVAKLLAVGAVVGIGVAALNLLSTFWFPFAIGGRWMPYSLGSRVGSHAAASFAGSVWAFTLVMALQGVCLTLVPWRWQRRASLGVLGLTLALLLLSSAFVVRMPALTLNAATTSQWPLSALPPVWFFALEQWLLLGSVSGYGDAARLTVLAYAVTVTSIGASYGWLFCSAERLVGDSVSMGHRGHRFGMMSFVVCGLTRSRLHQLVFLMIASGGLAILIGQILTVWEGASLRAAPPRAAVHAALAAPLLVALTSAVAVRTIFRLPVDHEAAWVFRITETPAMRQRALMPVVGVLTVGVLAPALLTAAVLQPHVIGVRWPVAAMLAILASCVLIELLLRDWRRIPYTCTYLPGKRVLAYTLGVLLAAYATFVYLGASLTRWALVHPARAMIYAGLLLAAFAALRRERLRTWGALPLEFEDADPDAVRPLNLLPDEKL